MAFSTANVSVNELEKPIILTYSKIPDGYTGSFTWESDNGGFVGVFEATKAGCTTYRNRFKQAVPADIMAKLGKPKVSTPKKERLCVEFSRPNKTITIENYVKNPKQPEPESYPAE